MTTDSPTLATDRPLIAASASFDPVIDDELARTLIGDNAADDLMIGGVPLPHDAEPAPILLAGDAGTAKIEAMHQLLDTIAKRGDTAIVYDSDGTYLPLHFRPERGDQILNPLDGRSPVWSLAAEIQTDPPATEIGDRVVAGGPPHIRSADLLSETIGMLGEATDGTMYHLFRAVTGGTKVPDIFRSTKDRALRFGLIAGSEGNVGVSRALTEAGERRASRRRRRTAAARNAFTVRGFLQASDIRQHQAERPWLFITPWPAEEGAVRPLFMEMVDAAVIAALQRRPRPQRRIWVIIDDLDQLTRPAILVSRLTSGDRPAVSIIAGISDTARLIGEGGLLFATFETVAVFRLKDRPSAGDAAMLMEADRDRLEGGGPWRGETSVTPADIMSLPDQACYLRVPGHNPIIRTDVDRNRGGARAARHAAFVDAAIEETIATALIRLYEDAKETDAAEPTNETEAAQTDDPIGDRRSRRDEPRSVAPVATRTAIHDHNLAAAAGPLSQLVKNLRCIQKAANALENGMANLRRENRMLKQMLGVAFALLFLVSIATGMAWHDVYNVREARPLLMPDDAPARTLRAPGLMRPAPLYLQDAPGTIRVGSAD